MMAVAPVAPMNSSVLNPKILVFCRCGTKTISQSYIKGCYQNPRPLLIGQRQ
jgi:hypothetical protein